MRYLAGFWRRRTYNVVSQIAKIHEPVSVIFGVAHTDLISNVQAATGRPTESHFPYEDYNISYWAELVINYLTSGKIDEALFLRSMLELIITSAYKSEINNRGLAILYNHYGRLLSDEQIVGFGDYYKTCSLFPCIPRADIFECYLKKHLLPLPSEILSLHTICKKLA